MKLRLQRLPSADTTKMTLVVTASMRELLARYCEAYEATYGERVEPERLIPSIVEQFLSRDKAFRAFVRGSARKARPQAHQTDPVDGVLSE